MKKVDCVKKVNGIINESIQQGKYEMKLDITHKDLEKFPKLTRLIEKFTGTNSLNQCVEVN